MGGMGVGGRGVQEEEDTCIRIADALHCTAETNKHCNAIIVQFLTKDRVYE